MIEYVGSMKIRKWRSPCSFYLTTRCKVRFQVDLGSSNVHNHREESALCDLYFSLFLNIKLSFGTVDPLPSFPPPPPSPLILFLLLPECNIRTKIRTGTIM